MKARVLFLCLLTIGCSAKKEGSDTMINHFLCSTPQTSQEQKDNREESFIREFYAKYLKVVNLIFEDGVSKDSANMASNHFRDRYYTPNLMQYRNAYYAMDENGEPIYCDNGCLITGLQDDEGLQPEEMIIEKKEQNWYTATYVWWLGGKINGVSCSRLKVIPNGDSFKVDSIMLDIYMEHECDTIYETKVLDHNPSFVGGEKGLREYLKTHGLTCRWDIAKDADTDCMVDFIVGKDGWTRKCVQLKQMDDELEKEIFYLIKNMPRWQSGVKDGENVASVVSLTLKKEKNKNVKCSN